MRAFLAAVAVGVVLTGCGSESPTDQTSTGITGHVLLGPTCPDEKAATPCPDQAVPAGVRVTVSQWRAYGGDLPVVATTETGADGEFQVSLPPGKYVVQADAGRNCSPIDVLVPGGPPTHVEVHCDTGIR